MHVQFGHSAVAPNHGNVSQTKNVPRFGTTADTATKKRDVSELTLGNLVIGLGKQAVRLNLPFFKALWDYKQKLDSMREGFKGVNLIKPSEAGGKPELTLTSRGPLNNDNLRAFYAALGDGANALLNLTSTLKGVDRSTVSLEEAMKALTLAFNTQLSDDEMSRLMMQVPGEAERPIYAEALDELEARAIAQNVTPKQGTIEHLFARAREAAMPSLPLSQAVQIVREIEASF